MVLLDGIEYNVKTPDENLDDVITYVNDYCAAKNITNSLGELIKIEPNEANPLYQMFRGFAYLTTVMQKLIYSAGCGMSIAEASERQLLNLADIAGIKRTQATRTVISGVAFAQLTSVTLEPCEITQDMTATLTIAGTDVVFHPAFDVTIPPGESRSIVLIAEQYGSYAIAANTITQFDDPISNLRMLSTAASIPGQDIETIAALRERMQRRVVEGTQVEKAETEIQNLEGVSMCSIYFNYSPSESSPVEYGDSVINVPPRQALILVQGWSAEDNAIAKAFYRHMLCQTVNAPGAQVQTYITHAQQQLSVYIIPPAQKNLYVKIFIKNTLSYEQVSGIKDTICSLAGSLVISQPVSSVDVTKVVGDVYTNLTIQGAELSITGEEGSYDYVQYPGSTAIFLFNAENISVVEV